MKSYFMKILQKEKPPELSCTHYKHLTNVLLTSKIGKIEPSLSSSMSCQHRDHSSPCGGDRLLCQHKQIHTC